MRSLKPIAPSTESRRGVVLLVVITLLALFTVVGLSFLYYADAEAGSSKAFREGVDLSRPDVEPEAALSYFLSKLIYGEIDDESGVYNAGRGHDLARGIYGADYSFQTINGVKTVVMNAHQLAYTGTGRLHFYYPAGTPIAGQDDYGLINYQYFASDGFLRDPERLSVTGTAPNFRASPSAALNPFIGGNNAPWTYPDLNSMYLGAVLADGTLLTPSFHREYLFGRLDDMTNANWTNAVGKYLTLRPRPNENPGFPFPDQRGGDVQNLPWGKGNDSIWIDFGAPVIIAEDGRKFKMLFAPLIIDLDGRVNLNVHGNIKNAGAYAGNQGWGRWEVNLNQVFPNNTATEVPGIFKGNGTVTGRYGANGVPSTAVPTNFFPVGPWFAKVDMDGVNSGPMVLPTAPTAANSRVTAFPTFPGGYANSNANELTNHPALYNYWYPQGDDRSVFPPASMEAFLRYGDKGSPALFSELFQLMPTNYSGLRVRGLSTPYSMDLRLPGLAPWIWNPANAQLHYAMPNTTVTTGPPSPTYPVGNPMPFHPISSRTAGGPGARSEYAFDWGAVPPVLTRLDLNRPLPDYPAPDATTGLITDTASFNAAQLARQNFARDIYNLLVRVTGARDPNAQKGTPKATNVQYQAARYLAQLAVNIVDYIDNDDYMTPFVWFAGLPASAGPPATAAVPAEIVYGTEIPRLVLNEAFAELDNSKNDPALTATPVTAAATKNYHLNVWAELLNTFRPTPKASLYPRDGGSVVLQNGTQVPYILQVCSPAAFAPAVMLNPANTKGDPDFNAAATRVMKTVNSWVTGAQTVQQILPSPGDHYAPPVTNPAKGFFVVGPPQNNNVPTQFQKTWTTNFATASLNIGKAIAANTANYTPPGLVLRRLACPHMPNQENSAAAFYNPYITVDYIENVYVNDARLTTAQGPVATVPNMANFYSVGRRQPYAGHISQWVNQNPIIPMTTPPPPAQPKNTFGRHNGQESAPPLNTTAAQTLGTLQGTAVTPVFDWLVHLDRPLISPMELLHVSAYQPHLLTHQFILPGAAANTVTKFQHYAPWFENFARLYRFFEFVRTHDYAVGMDNLTRVPGQININTIWDPEVFYALCNDNTAAVGQALYQRLLQLRSPTYASAATAANYPTGTVNAVGNVIGPIDTHMTQAQATTAGFTNLDRPIGSLATGFTSPNAPSAANPLGQTPNLRGIQNTLLQPATGSATTPISLFSLNGATHPYLQNQMLTKLFNNLTTRSNTFAVFVTVGFFQVTNDAVRPVQLGAEIGRAENRHVRHRFFAIIDRSDLRRVNFNVTPNSGTTMAANTLQQVQVPTSLTVGGNATQFLMTTVSGQACTIGAGDALVLEPGLPNEEVVQLASVTQNGTGWQMTFTPTRTHAMANASTPIPVAFRGNPGPWPNYRAREDTTVVRYFSVID